ncbi:permease [Shewanella marina]|uniref:permease n=1 Tax=Shewanella marina TaxID=487319 RepID=UPI000472B4D8|nr:permease [Shewanella marina]
MTVLDMVTNVISTFANMVWQIYWPLAFGLMLSSFIRNLIPVNTVQSYLGKTNVKSVSITTLLGMMSSSCSYAAASLTHTLLQKKATLANSMALLVASTNLIVEMFIVLVALLGWTFMWGEIVGGLILIITVALLFQHFYPKSALESLQQHIQTKATNPDMGCGMDMSSGSMDMTAKTMPEMQCGADMKHDDKAMPEMMCGADMKHDDKAMPEMKCGADMKHDAKAMPEMMCGSDMPKDNKSSTEMKCGAEMGCGANMQMDMATESKGLKASINKAASFFQMDIAMIGKEIAIGVVVSSIIIALVPLDFWRTLFISNDANLPMWLHSALDVVIGIFVAMIAYVCSVGNLILAAALWHGGISFGGVIGFILADVLTIPMLKVYKNYYGAKATKWIVLLLFIAILFTGIMVDLIFSNIDWSASKAAVRQLNTSGFGLNSTTILNFIFIPLSIWFYFTGKKQNTGMDMKM